MQCLQHLAGHLPHSSAAMPVFKLCGSQLSQENLTAGDSIRVFQVRSKGVPEPVDDLGAALHTLQPLVTHCGVKLRSQS